MKVNLKEIKWWGWIIIIAVINYFISAMIIGGWYFIIAFILAVSFFIFDVIMIRRENE